MCRNFNCPSKDSCYRFRATPSEYRQSYCGYTVEKGETKCNSFNKILKGDNIMKKYRLTKISDDIFDGEHPNGIDEGYIKEGYTNSLPVKGEMFFMGTLRTSTVTETLNEDSIFKTKNSTYKLEEL